MKEFEYRYKIKEIDNELKLNEKRKELDEKKKKVEEFISQKKKIQDEMRYLSDQYTIKKNAYHDLFNGMFSKKGLDEYAYMDIKGMISGDPKFDEIYQYYGY